MARKTKKVTAPRKTAEKSVALSSANSYKSLLYGIATVIVLFILGFSIAQMFVNRPSAEIDDQAVSVSRIEEALKQNQQIAKDKPGTYTVQENDSLWSIAEAKYNDGYKWTEIAKANNISSPDTIFKGNKLVIPAVSETSVAATSPTPDSYVDTQVTGDNTAVSPPASRTYVIKRGDDLWDIAVKVYGDGYKWTEIAKANNLTNPGLIHADNTLKLPL